jgi:uncharacterized protein
MTTYRKETLHDFEPAVYRHRGIMECRLNTSHISRAQFGSYLKQISQSLGMQFHPEQPEPIITSATGHAQAKHNGLEAMLFWLESGMHAYWWEQVQLLTLDMHSCTFLNPSTVERVTQEYFDVVEFSFLDLTPDKAKQDNPKVEIRNHPIFGKGVFAKENITKGEFIAGFYGEIFTAEDARSIPAVALNHALQFAENKWRDGLPTSAARYLNHSCNPNCGISGFFDLVSIREIAAGEELRWDYALTEDSNWEVPGGQCLCGASNCRGSIVPYRNLTIEEKESYRPFTSAWLLKKYA